MFKGERVLDIAAKHIGERYVFGARADFDDANYKGPWDCAEFCSWCVYQAYGTKFGVLGNDPYSGAWVSDARDKKVMLTVDAAAEMPGTVLIRAPKTGRTGHVAFSDGEGGTIEAHSTRQGVKRARVAGRSWDFGCYIPGIAYDSLPKRAETATTPAEDTPPPDASTPPRAVKVTQPYSRGAFVTKVQSLLQRLDLQPGKADGIFGPKTAAAVRNFQMQKGLAPDGIVGPKTATALGLDWPPARGSVR